MIEHAIQLIRTLPDRLFIFAGNGASTITNDCSPSQNTGDSFFGLPPWWKYMTNGHMDEFGTCVPNFNFSNNPEGIWAIGLAVLEILMRVAGYLAVIYIMIAGINYIMANGNPEEANKARQKIVNGFIGLGITLIAVVTVNFIGNTLG